MITGRTPFSGSTAVEVIQKHKFGLFDRPQLFVPELPVRVDDTICRLLEKDPDKRFPDALVLLRHLQQIVRLEEFATTGATLTGNPDDDMSSTTVATTSQLHGSGPLPAGPATLMQSLMRAELAEPEKGVVGRLFNNIYVLIALLGLLIAGGFWWFRRDEPTAEERFNRATALLEHEPGSDWLRAREDFRRLLEEDPDTWRERVDPLMQKIEVYVLTRSARGGRGAKSESPKSEADRLLQLGLHYRQIGELVRAERTLAALQALLEGNEQQAKLFELTAKLLEGVRGQLAQVDDRNRMLTGALERAAAQVEKGNAAEARKIWEGIVELYGNDPGAAEFVEEAKKGLAAHLSAK
jgi:serine/threonine-protein kinase